MRFICVWWWRLIKFIFLIFSTTLETIKDAFKGFKPITLVSNNLVSMAPVPCKVEITTPALYGCWKPKSDQESIVQHLEQDKH